MGTRVRETLGSVELGIKRWDRNQVSRPSPIIAMHLERKELFMQQARSNHAATVATEAPTRQRKQNRDHAKAMGKLTETVPVFPMFICILMGFLVTVITSLLFGFILSVGNLPLTLRPVFVMISLFAGAFVCGKACGRAFPKERGLMALICALAGTIALVLINLFFFREPITVISFMKYTVIIVGCVLGAVLRTGKPSRRKRRYPKA